MQDYKPNSHRFKEEQKLEQNSSVEAGAKKQKVTPVVSNTAKIKKKGPGSKFVSAIVGDMVGEIKSYIVNDVVIPTTKDTIWSIATNTLDMILYRKQGGHRSSRSNRGRGSNVSYRAFYDEPRNTSSRHNLNEPKSNSRFDYDTIVFATRGDAEAVLEQMCNIIDEYDIVTVGAMYDAADISNPDYTCENFGWNNLRNAKVMRVRDGYIIELPKARPINQL